MQNTLNNQLTSRIDNNTLTHTYQYDANGNQTQSTGNNARIIEYTPFNKTKKLTTKQLTALRLTKPPMMPTTTASSKKPTMIQTPAPTQTRLPTTSTRL
ncbi:hypothetical protein BSPWISOXPB_9510 [uncultured Gammaproteobacteria bacterium]|nr:hypothetical protein BSPWISOXPB_9510 [uncultured Gammaproteobacteria bacterium]